MFKIKAEFDRIVLLADAVNKKLGKKRFYSMTSGTKRFTSYGLYDSENKTYVLFDTIMFSGHYNYNKNVMPSEFAEMEEMLTSEI